MQERLLNFPSFFFSFFWPPQNRASPIALLQAFLGDPWAVPEAPSDPPQGGERTLDCCIGLPPAAAITSNTVSLAEVYPL